MDVALPYPAARRGEASTGKLVPWLWDEPPESGDERAGWLLRRFLRQSSMAA
jgi:hypothetical protein